MGPLVPAGQFRILDANGAAESNRVNAGNSAISTVTSGGKAATSGRAVVAIADAGLNTGVVAAFA